jgi:allantoinase
MALPDDYLRYPHRRYGADQGRYPWRRSGERPFITWPDGAAIAVMIVVPIEHHTLTPPGMPFKHPGAMVTPYPDLRHYTSRDYGNRVGVYRILRELKNARLKATFPINAGQLGRLAPLVESIANDGHEIAAYGLSSEQIHWGGLDPAEEQRWIDQVRAAFRRHSLEPRVWLSPARQESFATLDLIAAAGFTVCLDWEHDTVPVTMKCAGGSMTALPLSNELDDRALLIDRRQTETEWADQIMEAAKYLRDESASSGGQVLGFTLTPYVTGQPFRIAALRQILGAFQDPSSGWVASASEIAAAGGV